ncbi:hypothetical protein BC827DRAFT_1268695 [Russula dissimulans]|nr:hypothetical protein BC827DRAFT_1268695 [Russula dissimulans]
MAQSSVVNPAIPFFVVSFFMLYFVFSGLQHEFTGDPPNVLMNRPSFPDFGRYRHTGILTAEQL